jgi:hypothetical protein
MADVPTWERLSAATERIMATAGLSKEDAQSLICRAVADGILKFRGKVGQHATRPIYGNRVLEKEHFEILADIKPEDLDWEKSRPLNPWGIRREILNQPGLWNVDWIEVFSADVTKLCSARSQGVATQRPSRETGATRRSQPAFERARRAIDELFPDGVPGQADVPNAILCRRVGVKLKNDGLPNVSDDTILRAAGRRK